MHHSKALLLPLAFMLIQLAGSSSAVAQLAPDYTFTGNAGDRFGFSVSSAGDVNGDTYEDFVVGAPLAGGSADSGAMYVYSGATGTLMFQHFGLPFWGFGWAVAGAGDVNNDGFDDLIVGAPFADTVGTDRGVAYVYAGPAGALIRVMVGANPGDNFGQAVDGAGDINGDLFDDVIVGSPSSDTFGLNCGLVAVYSGQTGARLRLHGGAAGDQLGWAVHGAGLVNGDANFDYAAGAPFSNTAADSAGKLIVYSGATGSVIWTFLGATAGDLFGYAFDAGGNYDNFTGNDNDFVIGSPLSDWVWPDGGQTTIYYGDAGVQNGSSGRVGETAPYYGAAVVWAGDLNADDRDDYYLSAPYSDGFGPDVGFVSSITPIGSPFFEGGEHPGDLYGTSIAAADVSGDGLKDLIVGAPSFPGGADSGKVYVYLQRDLDSDGVVNGVDNCPATPNPGQADLDGDQIGDACDVGDTLKFTLLSPVDMVVTDPAGDSIGIGFNTIQQGSTYDSLTDVNGDLESDDRVTIPNAMAGPYKVRIIPELDANPSDQFTLTIRIDGNQQFIPDDYHDQTISALGNTVPDTYVWSAALTLPGDCTADGVTTAADIIYLVNYVFKGGPNTPVPGHGDTNCDGVVTSADIIGLVNYVFKSGQAPCSTSAG